MQNFKKETCHCCGQTTNYLLPVDLGSVEILKAISVAIRKKGKNSIHPRKEMEVASGQLDYERMVREGLLTSNQVGNLSKLKFHGLIASIEGELGNHCLTRKGSQFLKGSQIPKYAVISKIEKCNLGYWDPENSMVTIKDFAPTKEYWEGMNYDVMAPNGSLMQQPLPFNNQKASLNSRV